MRISFYAYPSGDRIADDITIEDGLTGDEVDKKVIEAIMGHIEYGWHVSSPEKENEKDD